jgi:hypothetical protein
MKGELTAFQKAKLLLEKQVLPSFLLLKKIRFILFGTQISADFQDRKQKTGTRIFSVGFERKFMWVNFFLALLFDLRLSAQICVLIEKVWQKPQPGYSSVLWALASGGVTR